jgi:pimeloyl-ACP methyl ester carboxylesterase
VSDREVVELSWNVDGLTLKGLAWGDPADPPVLALHGWLDNAASFALLAPQLKDHYVVAVDLTGHGQSDWRSADATYQVYDDIPQIVGVVDQLGWNTFDLLGHSRGAIISSILAATFPERVSHLVLLDGVSPPPLPEAEFVSQLRSYVKERKRLLARKPRVYASIEAAVAAREEQGLPTEAATLIATRNLRPCEGGHALTTDLRLRGASAIKLTPGQVDAMLNALTTPTLLLMAEQGLAVTHARRFSAMDEQLPRAQVETFPGGHHFHMEGEVATLGKRIQAFIKDQN